MMLYDAKLYIMREQLKRNDAFVRLRGQIRDARVRKIDGASINLGGGGGGGGVIALNCGRNRQGALAR